MIKILMISIVTGFSGTSFAVEVNGAGWICSAIDGDGKTYDVRTVNDSNAPERAERKCRAQSSKPKTCQKIYPCVRVFGAFSMQTDAVDCGSHTINCYSPCDRGYITVVGDSCTTVYDSSRRCYVAEGICSEQ